MIRPAPSSLTDSRSSPEPPDLNPREILKLSSASEYDFRVTACPGDRLKDRFPEWVSYYRTMWAIARALQPASILEVGVRYGYSAAAFLDGCASAHYLGIGLHSEEFGGAKGAIDWARRITANYSAQFIVADSRKIASFPGGTYDLVHVDGQQDGDGSFHHLELAIHQGRIVLADGFFGQQQNFQAISAFLFRYRDLIEYFLVIPGYAGELLIKPHSSAFSARESIDVKASEELRLSYTVDYYLKDCGGFAEYQNTGGKKLEDTRLSAVAAVASLIDGGRVLDLGCGRGELAYHFAQQGFRVTAVDYSDDAIRLTGHTFEGSPDLRSRVELRCANICEIDLSGVYDIAVASDAIELLTANELDALYEKVAQHLAPAGIFVVHTYPNIWYFKYDYARRRRLASYLGAYLPKEPRTRYELLMHINEQNPRVFRRQLSRHFANVLLWFGEPGNMGGSLLQSYSHRQLAASRDLWAIASHRAIDPDAVRSRLQSNPLPSDQMNAIQMTLRHFPAEIRAEQEFLATLEISNGSAFVLSSVQPFPVNISYHWIHDDGRTEIFDGIRSRMQPLLVPGATCCFEARVVSPSLPARYILRFTLVQEGIQWFDASPIQVMADAFIDVFP